MVGGEALRRAGQALPHARIQAFQQRQHFVAHLVAEVGRVGVGDILARGETEGGTVGFDAGAGDGQQRAEEDQAGRQALAGQQVGGGQRGDGLHPAQTGQTAAPDQVHQDGLGLVIGGMAQGDTARADGGGGAGQERIAGAAGGFLDAQPVPAGQRRSVDALSGDRQAPGAGRLRDERGVGAARFPAQTMIERGDVQPQAKLRAGAVQQVQQAQGIRAAGDGHQQRPAGQERPGSQARQRLKQVREKVHALSIVHRHGRVEACPHRPSHPPGGAGRQESYPMLRQDGGESYLLLEMKGWLN